LSEVGDAKPNISGRGHAHPLVLRGVGQFIWCHVPSLPRMFAIS
jgi:hypothetical protein